MFTFNTITVPYRERGMIRVLDFSADPLTYSRQLPSICSSAYDEPSASFFNLDLKYPYDSIPWLFYCDSNQCIIQQCQHQWLFQYILVYWYISILVYWYIRILVYWHTNMHTGILVFWLTSMHIGILAYHYAYWYSGIISMLVWILML